MFSRACSQGLVLKGLFFKGLFFKDLFLKDLFGGLPGGLVGYGLGV